MAAAHAACYAMALNATLGRKNASAEKTVVTAKVTADLGTGIHHPVLAPLRHGLWTEGRRAGQFEAVAQEAEKACPVSNAYRGSLKITLDARVG
jgi:osmotically inducible protein OsmC